MTSNQYIICMRTNNRGSGNYVTQAIHSLANSNAYTTGMIQHICLFNTDDDVTHLSYIAAQHKECHISIPDSSCNGIENTIRALRHAALFPDCHVLFCEDDILFAKNWLQYLDAWTGDYFSTGHIIASLYSPYSQVKMVYDVGERFWECPLQAFYGTQCILINNTDAIAIADILQNNYKHPELFSWTIRTIADDKRGLTERGIDIWIPEIFYHLHADTAHIYAIAPSLVQHTGKETGSRCTFHTSPSFLGTAPDYAVTE